MKNTPARVILSLVMGFVSSTFFAWLAGANMPDHERGPGLLLWFWGIGVFGLLCWVCSAKLSSKLTSTDTAVVAITFSHPSWLACDIVTELAWPPSTSWNVGESEVLNSGKRQSGVYPMTTCVFEFKSREKVATQALDVAIRRLVEKTDYVKSVIDSGGSVDLTIRFGGKSPSKVALSNVMVSAVAKLGLSARIEYDAEGKAAPD